MPQIYYLPCYDYVNNTLWRVTVMTLTTESSAFLYSYLPVTPNILLATLLSQTLNLCSSLDIRQQISHPHKMKGTMSLLQMSIFIILNWTAACIAWEYSALFSPKIMVLLKFCLDLTYLKLDLQQCDSDTSQAKWHKIQIVWDITIKSVQNPFCTVQLFYEYRLLQKPHILNTCHMWTTLNKLLAYYMICHWLLIFILCYISDLLKTLSFTTSQSNPTKKRR